MCIHNYSYTSCTCIIIIVTPPWIIYGYICNWELKYEIGSKLYPQIWTVLLARHVYWHISIIKSQQYLSLHTICNTPLHSGHVLMCPHAHLFTPAAMSQLEELTITTNPDSGSVIIAFEYQEHIEIECSFREGMTVIDTVWTLQLANDIMENGTCVHVFMYEFTNVHVETMYRFFCIYPKCNQ